MADDSDVLVSPVLGLQPSSPEPSPHRLGHARHQMLFLARNGFRAVAPDMRGFGASDSPRRRQAFDSATLCADMVALLRQELRRESCLLVGHDWGAILAWQFCLFEPACFVALCAMSVPPMYGTPLSPIEHFAKLFGSGDAGLFFYILYHNETTHEDGSKANGYGEEAATDQGPAEAEYDGDVEGTLRRLYLLGTQSSLAGLRREKATVAGSARADGGHAGWLPRLPAVPQDLPLWLPAADLAYFVEQYKLSGFRGGVNLYRNFKRNWQLTKHFTGSVVQQPVLFVAGAEDNVVHSYGGIEGAQRAVEAKCTQLERCLFLEDTGHWCQQENAEEVNAALLDFVQRHQGLLAGSPATSRM
mmetsp:Transcript_129493/g.415059  ORF Transcript_129493/g.415059 Transcript_129493/m.415059 type:complete len:359 (+) Transcript_129493:104-1180(+)